MIHFNLIPTGEDKAGRFGKKLKEITSKEEIEETLLDKNRTKFQ